MCKRFMHVFWQKVHFQVRYIILKIWLSMKRQFLRIYRPSCAFKKSVPQNFDIFHRSLVRGDRSLQMSKKNSVFHALKIGLNFHAQFLQFQAFFTLSMGHFLKMHSKQLSCKARRCFVQWLSRTHVPNFMYTPTAHFEKNAIESLGREIYSFDVKFPKTTINSRAIA